MGDHRLFVVGHLDGWMYAVDARGRLRSGEVAYRAQNVGDKKCRYAARGSFPRAISIYTRWDGVLRTDWGIGIV